MLGRWMGINVLLLALACTACPNAGGTNPPQNAASTASSSSQAATRAPPGSSLAGSTGSLAPLSGSSSGVGSSASSSMPLAGFSILGITGQLDSTVDAQFTGVGLPTVAWSPSAGQAAYEVTLLDDATGGVRCPAVTLPSNITQHTYVNCRGALRPMAVYQAQVLARDAHGNSTLATNSPLSFMFNATALAQNSSIEGSGPVVANGVDVSTVTITLHNAQGAPLEGQTPTFEATNTGGLNVYGACSSTTPAGVSWCTLASNIAETKGLTLLTPVVLTGGTVIFQESPAVAMLPQDGATRASVGACSAPFTVAFANPRGNTVPAGTAVTLTLTQDGAGGGQFFTDVACATPAITTLDALPQDVKKVFYFMPSASGLVNLTVRGTGLEAAAFHVNVVALAWANMTITGAPALRSSHVTAWTGTEMLVWGGVDTAAAMANSGGKYNPALDVWTPMSSQGAPSGTADATAVWSTTTQEMLVWGGAVNEAETSTTATGGRYNPATNAWRPLSTLGAPSRRSRHTAVWTGSEMLVWGGCDSAVTLATGARYSPALDAWTPMAPPPSSILGRCFHSAVWTGSEMVVWGGGISGAMLNDGGRYDPNLNAWRLVERAGAPTPRGAHTAVWTGNDMVVWGGVVDAIETAQNTGGSYSPTTGSWKAASLLNAPTARYLHSAVWTGTRMVVWGGLGANNLAGDVGRSYAPAADAWILLPTEGAPSGRYHHSALWTGSQLLIWGGNTGTAGLIFTP